MATFYSTNYEAARITRPNDKFKKGENGGKVRALIGQLVVPDSLALNDVIELGDIPANSRIVGAKVLINKSLGATGQIGIGHAATKDEDGNDISLANAGVCAVADAGGQAALSENGAAQTIIQSRLGQTTRVFGHCAEAVDGNVDDAVATLIVYYIND